MIIFNLAFYLLLMHSFKYNSLKYSSSIIIFILYMNNEVLGVKICSFLLTRFLVLSNFLLCTNNYLKCACGNFEGFRLKVCFTIKSLYIPLPHSLGDH